MRTWQMIKELTENPKKVFMRKYDLLIVKIDKTTKTLSWESGFEHLSTDDEWVEIKQPATWQEAIQALVDGKVVDLEVNGITIRFGRKHNMTLVDGVQKGKWYILGEEGKDNE